MQRLGGQRLIQRSPARTSPWDYQVRPLHHRRRKPLWPRRREPLPRYNFPSFEASPLLLDLDDEDNKYVRAYNEELDGVLETAREVLEREMLPMRKRAEDFETQSTQYKTNLKKTAAEKFNPWQISDHDVLTTTLLGASPQSISEYQNFGSQPSELVNYILDQNGIPHIMRNNTVNLAQYMMRRLWLARRSSQTFGAEEPLEHALERCRVFPEIKRLIGRLIQTPEGCQLVSKSISALLAVCKDSLNQLEPRLVLSFLNDLTINFSQRGQQIPTELLERGLETSLQGCAFGAAHMYLKFLFEANHMLSNSALVHILKTIRELVTPNNKTSGPRFRFHDATQLLAVFSLLTGRVLGENSTRPSLRDMICNPIGESHQIYLECLAQLGAFRTMWHEWQRDIAPTQPTRLGPGHATQEEKLVETPGDELPADGIIEPGTEDKHDNQKESAKQEVFIKAMHFAVSTGYRAKFLARLTDFTATTGQYPEDYQLDIEAIIKSTDPYAFEYPWRNTVSQHDEVSRYIEVFQYNAYFQCSEASQHNTGLQADMRDVRETVEIFNKRSTLEALRALQAFLKEVRSAH